MSDDKPMKSSYELAMERLRKKDEEAGIETKPVTDAQKAAIAEIRNFYEAKMAEQEVLHQSAVLTTLDPEARAAIDAQDPSRPRALRIRTGREDRKDSKRRVSR